MLLRRRLTIFLLVVISFCVFMVIGAAATASVPTLFLSKTMSSPLYTLTYQTPKNKTIYICRVLYYAGFAKGPRCDRDFVMVYSSPECIKITANETQILTTEQIFQFQNYLKDKLGSWTCMRVDYIYKGKQYSTGYISLTYDPAEKTYTKAIPSKGFIKFEE